jgi:predicted GIY-YIG superfamily endonuclease
MKIESLFLDPLFLYGLFSNNQCFYVGETNNPFRRACEHTRDGCVRQTVKAQMNNRQMCDHGFVDFRVLFKIEFELPDTVNKEQINLLNSITELEKQKRRVSNYVERCIRFAIVPKSNPLKSFKFLDLSLFPFTVKIKATDQGINCLEQMNSHYESIEQSFVGQIKNINYQITEQIMLSCPT